MLEHQLSTGATRDLNMGMASIASSFQTVFSFQFSVLGFR
jgi:hypothetical protein